MVAEPTEIIREFETDEDQGQKRSRGRWIDFRADADPIVWLDEQMHPDESADAEHLSARRAHLRALVTRLDERYLENPRMLANRAAQLMRMLADLGVQAELLPLLEDFAELTPGQEGREDQFGELCAHYVNLRRAGADHQAAIAELTRAASVRGHSP